ncbi:MAG: sigma 54-interacting transcriptional regulator [Gammaproteobacteria bacterium]|nr:sigma 54-interacting transcriptional regulator [Gammaproteobacteria bacterium]
MLEKTPIINAESGDQRDSATAPRRKLDRELQQAFEDQLDGLLLITQLSATFINIDAAILHDAIQTALEKVTRFVGGELATFIVTEPKSGVLQHSHQWLAPGFDFDIDFTEFDLNETNAPWLSSKLKEGDPVVIHRRSDFPEEAVAEKAVFDESGAKSVLWVPFRLEGQVAGSIAMNTFTREVEWSDLLILQLKLIGEVFANALKRRESEQQLQVSFDEIKRLNNELKLENTYLLREIDIHSGYGDFVGSTPPIKRLLTQVEQVAPLNSTVLIQGPTGTGKELVANLVHRLSQRVDNKLISVNCAALPEGLIEAELFGREKGAFTGALSKQIGRFELADNSTLFLDEVSELPLELQAKLLRVLQNGEFEKLGSNETIRVDVRIIAATNRDLAEQVASGRFREDLYYRLNVFPIEVPPLKLRRDDIPALAWSFVREFGETMGKTVTRISKQTMKQLQAYDWPGNVRELRNVIERSMILTQGDALVVNITSPEKLRISSQTMVEVEREHIRSVLEQTGWRVRGDGGAAEILDLKPTTLDARIKKLNLQKPRN